MSEFWEEGELLQCYNHCGWTGTIADLDNPSEDVYLCPRCGASTSMILSVVPDDDDPWSDEAAYILACGEQS